jgi:DMSO/TMAO reductase YedYZ molybdopterin-dependent catalytic subunit
MRGDRPWIGVFLGASITLPWVTLLYLGYQSVGFGFPAFDLFDLLTRILPDSLVTFSIDALIASLNYFQFNVADAAQIADQSIALGVYIALATLLGSISFIAFIKRKTGRWDHSGLFISIILGLPLIFPSIYTEDAKVNPWLNLAWLILMLFLWETVLAWATQKLYPVQAEGALEISAAHPQVKTISRRQFLINLGTASVTLTVIGSGLDAVLNQIDDRKGAKTGSAEEYAWRQSGERQLPNQDDPVVPAPGTRPEYTPVEDHYKVSIQLDPPEIVQETWQLPVTGWVNKPLSFSLDDLRTNFTARSQYVTLACISGGIPTSLIGTTLWEGVSIQEVLAATGLKPEAHFLKLTSADGFYETVSLDSILSDERIMFCYAWDGKPLPVEHGFPLRIWIPDRFGMKQPKWITSVEVIDSYDEGYWVRRGWDEVARVKTRSVIDTVAVNDIVEIDGEKRVPIGGIAYSGARGISKVEVRVDNEAWHEAKLRLPLSETTWVIWRYNWLFKPGSHLFEVRCFEGNGSPQITISMPPHPSGATGLHSVKINS